MAQALDRIRIVLVNTSHPGNIGAAARSMKTMGLSQLYLVQPTGYPSADAIALASGAADDVLKSARICDSLEEALTDCVLAIGTSARSRSLEWPLLDPEQCVQTLLQHAGKGDVALVFGRERTGLTNEELARCQFMTSIPANPLYNSLNLASAVQIYGYELCRAQEKDLGLQNGQADDTDEPQATSAVIESFHEHLQQTLRDIGVIEDGHPHETLLRRLRRLFNKARLTVTEINILRGIFSAAQARKQRRGNG
ncbi:MAG TPA: RNA methyltransferase [Gammaproteobacteria bacterium]|nr:RNA methyltransferase [Gammaproteobacteria bacterium]